jgi:phosphatidate phosphatase APP1
VLQDEGFRPTGDRDRRWRNLVAFYKRLESDEVPYARVRILSQEFRADREGFFNAEITGRFKPGWHEIDVQHESVTATARVLVPSPRARFGIISDIDDTIVFSNVKNKLKMVLALALSNSRTRKPFAGVAAFYQALHAGVNPLFYVSKSPWNLYVPLMEYLEHQKIPLGPLILRDFGLRLKKRPDHKTSAIETILQTYPGLKFVLVGDSGEHDPEIYAAIVRRFPERISVIYIRSVDPNPSRIKAIEALVRQVRPTGCQLVLAPDSEFAAAHAAGEGLIAASALAAVRGEKKRQ